MVSLRSRNVTDGPPSSRTNKAAACLPLACGLLADSSSVASSNSSAREESEASEKTDQLGDLSLYDYSDSEVDFDEELSVESTQTSVIESGSGLADQVIITANDSQATAPTDRISKSLRLSQHKRKRLDDGDTDIIEDSNGEGSSPVHRRKLRKAVSVQSYLESENLWMNKTLGVIEKSIKNCGRVTSLLDTGKPMGEVGGNNTKIPFTEIGRLLKKQEQALVNLQLYIQRCGARESKITGKWQRAK
ncbi:hypothetical protein V499_00295 [Pseudogymnoascus sp. VKM F-103]|nr:hypothetical protein V499_00295 [Pseudogymnoascus sp. VKM F-103]